MLIVTKVDELRSIVGEHRMAGKTIGFVPTMGALHSGHISLVQEAKLNTDFVVMSIFVNPSQFGPSEDFSKYPRDFEKDEKLCFEAGVDLIFYPEVDEMYPGGSSDLSGGKFTFVEPRLTLADKLCGASRPGHFRGVTTVVSKLFNIVTPDKAFFGQKDAQQLAIIEAMARDLNMNIDIVPCPIIRDMDGLAMSSRNAYLSPEQRREALVLVESIRAAERMAYEGRSSLEIIAGMREIIGKAPSADIDYVKVVSAESLEDVERPRGDTLIALAVNFGTTRLIDNARLVI